MNASNKSAWITWENQTRNTSMSSRIGANIFILTTKYSGFLRYLTCIFKTIPILIRHRKQTVFAQNPSIILCLLCVLLKPLLRYRLIVDAHNAGIYPIPKLQAVANFIIRKANFVIVTNEALAAQVTVIGGNALILPDPIPLITAPSSSSNTLFPLREPSVLFICSWASDEPYCEILAAAKNLNHVNFYITGKSKGKEKECNNNLGENVILTGYVSAHDFHKLLHDANIIVDLTTRENCLVCGAYEAISVRKPLILSDTLALRQYFGDFAFFVNNSADSILMAIKNILDDYEKASLHAQVNADKIEAQWQSAFTVFKNNLLDNTN
jgi:glycosyltransferase involved in cell wall biosynthesis